ncbi:beta-propeller fold lactonase family protein [Wenzhouxiangella sediminis]|uniref:DUF11 domain-containing protein n=1 Tax=Wenzhouxiangella sediminis TaxID=1792836 RepID=A0A3E1KC02_9GAMM|nr:beta-propeller fold lactonase family protein [Wenzhouxiangella sediminis]RFF32029.1 DUF11 domain-containing protein [Wenzhouxiangella sediminis]
MDQSAAGSCGFPGLSTTTLISKFLAVALAIFLPAVAQSIEVDLTGPAGASGGAQFDYTITVTASSAEAPVADVSVVHSLPAGLVYAGAGGAGWTCSVSGSPDVVTCDADADLSAGDHVITVSVDAAAQASDAVLSNAVALEVAANEQATDTLDTTIYASDLSVSKLIDDGASLVDSLEVAGSDSVTFEIAVENLAPAEVANVRVRDVMPTGLDVDDNPQDGFGTDWSCTVSAGPPETVNCDYDPATLAAGATTSPLILTATAPDQDVTLTNVAEAESDASASSWPHQSADATVDVFLESDLRINKSADTATVYSGESLTYTYTISNLGPHEATNVTVVDTFDRENAVASYSASPASDWTCQELTPAPVGETVIECQLDAGLALPPNGSNRVLELTVTPSAVDDPIELGNQAVVEADQRLPDSPQNTSALVSVDLEPSADLLLSRGSVPANPVDAESTFSWTMQVDNDGPSLARDIALVESVPEGVIVTGFSSSEAWACSANQRLGSYRCEIDELAVGTSTLTISALAPRNPSLPGEATAPSAFGGAQVEAATHDPLTGNNAAASDSVTFAAVWDLSILKDSESELLVPEQAFTYDITVSNAGPSDLVGGLRPMLEDAFDSRLRGVIGVCATSATEPCWSCGWDQRPAWDQTLDTGAAATTGLGGAWSVSLSPDRNHIYVGGRFEGAIAVLDRDNVRGPEYGRLSLNGINEELTAPRVLAVHPNGEWLVAAGHGSAAELTLFSRNASTGSLAAVFTLGATLDSPSDLVFSPDGRFLYLAESGGDRIRQIALDAEAQSLSVVGDIVRDATGGNPVLIGGVAGLALSPDGSWLYAAAPDDQAVVAFAVDGVDGGLTPLSTASTALDNGSGPVAVRVVEVGEDELFVGGQDSVFAVARDSGSGLLGAATAFVASAVPDRRLEGVSGLALTADGDTLFVSAAADAAITLFERGSGGAMQFVRSVGLPGGLQANDAVLDATDERLYVSATSGDVSGATAPDTGAVLVFRTVAAGACNDLRRNEVSDDPLEDVALTLPAGQSVVVTIHAAVKAGTATGTLSNTAELTAAPAWDEASGQQLSSTKELDIRNATEVVVTTNAPGQRPVPGTDFSFTVEIVNNGPSGVTGLSVTDLLPAYPGDPAGFVSSTREWQCSASENACCNPGAGQCGVLQPTPFQSGGLDGHEVNLGAQSSLTLTLRGRLHPAATPNATLTNEVQLSMPAGIEAFSPDDLTDTHSVDLTAEADVWLKKESLGTSADENGMYADFRLTVGNFGPSAVRGVNLQDPLDDPSLTAAGASWSCSIVDGGESSLAESCCGYQSGACQSTDLVGQSGPLDQDLALAPQARAELLVSVPIFDEEAAEVENTASATTPADVDETDPVNNVQSATTRLLATADLDITKEILAGSSVVPGEQVQFQITLTNDGPDGVPVTVSDLFGPELTEVAWTCDATTPIPGDLIYDFDLGLGESLADASAVVSSADGRHVYALGGGAPGEGEEAIPATVAVFERNVVPGPGFGALTQLEIEIEGVDDGDDSGLTVAGLSGGRAMTLSPDQRHLYIASADANAVTVFRREHVAGSEDYGRLVFVETRALGSEEPADSFAPVTGLRGASDVAVSEDGEHVYVVGREDHAVAIFRRNPATGTLAFEGEVRASSLGLPNDGMWGANSIEIAPNDRDIYVTGSGREAGFSGPDWVRADYGGTYGQTYFVNNTSGVDLKWLTQEQSIPLPSFDELYLEFEHRFDLDTPFSCFDVGVLQYSLDGGDSWQAVADPGSAFETGGYNGTQNGYENNPLSGSPGWCNRSPGYASGFDAVRLNLTDLAAPGDELMVRFGLGEGQVIGATGWWVDNLRLYSVTGGVDTTLLEDEVSPISSQGNVVHFQRQVDDTAVGFGDLTPVSALAVDPAGSINPRADLAGMDGQGENLYVGGNEGTIVVYGRDSASGALSREQTVSLSALDASGDLPDGIEAGALAGLDALSVSLDGEHLVASGRSADRLMVFRRQPFVGTLQPMQMVQPGLADVGRAPGGAADVRDAVFSADGRHVFTVTGTGQLGVFERLAPDPTYGFLEAVFDGADDGFGNEASGLLGARGASLSSDGQWLYVAGFGQVGSGDRGSLAIFERDSGATEPGRHLRFREAFRDLQGGVEGLDGALDVVALRSDDGTSEDIYVASERDSAVAHFRQQLASGAAAFIGVYRNGEAGVTGLAGTAAITASPGGQYVFAAGRFDHAVAVFARDPVDGSLTHLGEARDGVDGVAGMLGANALAMSRDGAHLYVASRQSDSVVVLEHDAGMLTYRQTFYDGNEGAVITSPTGIDVTHDAGGGEHVIVTSLDGDAVTVLRRESDPGLETLYGRVRFQQTLLGGAEGLEALISPRDVVVDPSNDRVYVAADGGDALIVLDRNTSVGGSQFGQLYPLETRQNNTRGIIGVGRPYGLAVSRGSRRNIYTASLGSQSVAAFVRRAGSSCAASGGGNLSEEVFIAADGTIRFTVTAIVDPAATGELVNEATISVGDDVTNTGTNTADQSDPRDLAPSSELTISKDNGRLSVVAGETDDYRIVIGNEGPSHARDVTVQDLLSANDQFDESTAAWSCRAIGAGQLRRQASLKAGTGVTAGLDGLSALAWTAAPAGAAELGERVYVTGLLGNSLTALSIDGVSGEFIVDDRIVEGGVDVDGAPVAGLRGARDVIVGGNGSHIYVSSQVDDSLLVFEPELGDPLNADYGRLRLIEVHSPDDPGLESLDQPQGMALSQDGTSLYLAAANSGGVFVFSRDTGAGTLTLQQTIDTGALPELNGASRVLVAPEDGHVYVAGTGAGAVTIFERASDGTLTHLQTRQAPAIPGLEGVADLAFSPLGEHLYAAGRDADSIVVFPRDNDSDSDQFGRLASPIQQLDDAPGLLGPRALRVSADGGSLYVAAFESSSILVFRRDRETGQLSTVSRQIDGSGESGLSGVSSLAFSGDGETLFSGAVLDGAVVQFDRAGFSRCSVDSGAGDLDLVVDVAAGGEIVIDLSVDVHADAEGVICPEPLDSGRQCVVNAVEASWSEPGGARSVSAEDASFLDAAARLTIDKTDNLAEFRGLAGARALAGTETLGSHLYVAAPGEPGLGVYDLSPSTGPTGSAPLTFEQLVLNGDGPVSELNGISDLLVSPDGRHVYAASSLDSAVVAFERDPTNGHLSWLATYSNNASGVIGLAGARSMAMDSQGRHLYVAGTNGNAVVVFDRQHDADEDGYGTLSYNGLSQNGTDGVIDMARPVHLTLSSDDRHLYVAATQSDSVVVFSRNADAMSATFGALEWRQSRRNLVGSVSGLLDVSKLLVSPDGAFLYAAGTGNNAVVRFARNTVSGNADFGRLSFEEVLIDGEGDAAGLVGVDSLDFMGGSAEWLVAGSRLAGTLALFQRDTVSGELQFSQSLAERDDLAGASDLWPTPDGSRLHVAAADADSVSVFELSAGNLAPAGAVVQGGGGAVPGGAVEYLITVHNEGPSRVEGARVTDFFPDQFDSVSWSCQIVGPTGSGSSCPNGQFSGNVDATISLAAGDSAIIEAIGTLRPDASGGIVNEARVELPAGIVDLGGGDNLAVDDDTTINNRSDLRVEFQDLPAEAVAGSTFDMRVVVHNDGPGALAGSRVGLQLPEALLLEDWICQPDVEPGLLELADQTGNGLDLARAATLSRDGRHVYAVGEESGDDVLAVFERDPLTGNITLRQQLFNLEPDGSGSSAPVVDGLAGGFDILVSPDDAHVYVAGRADDAIAAFERDDVTGQLAFVGVIRDGVGAVDGLAGARSLTISEDGENVYVAGELDDAIAVLSRDATSGALGFQQVRRNLQGGVQNLDGPVDLLLVDDGNALWAAAPAANAIVRFDRSADGSLTPDGFFVQGGPDGDGGTLDGLAGVRSLAMRADGVVVTLARNGADHSLSLFDRPGLESLLLRHRLADGDEVGTPSAIVSGLAGADEVIVDPVRDVIYTAARDTVSGLRTVSAFVEDDSTGDMQFLGNFAGGSEAGSPASVLLGGDGRQLYLAGGPTIDRFRVLAGSRCERLGKRQLVDTVDLVSGGRVVYDLQASVMANARGAFDLNAGVTPQTAGTDPDPANNTAVVTVPIRAESALSVAKSVQDGPLVAGEDGNWLVTVTNNGPSSIRDIVVSDFLPTLPGSIPDPGGAGVVAGSGQWQCTSSDPLVFGSADGDADTAGLRAVAISEDGLWAAAASPASAQLRLYSRQAGTGSLTLADSLSDGDEMLDENDAVVAIVAGLAGAADLAFSRDGRHLYVVSQSGDSVARFAVDTEGGGLVYEGLRSNGESAVIGLDGPVRVIAGPADDRIYIGARDSSAVTVFGRDPVDGSLQWRQSMRSGIGLPLDVLDGVRDLVISPDGAHLYAAAADHDAIVIFELDGEGDLAYLDNLANGDAQGGLNVVGLGLVQSLVISPQGQHVYAASLADDSVSRFTRDPLTGLLQFEEQIRNGQEVSTGLDGASALVMADDGQYLYAGSRNDGGVLVFEREWTDGSLVAIDRLEDRGLVDVRRLIGDADGLMAAIEAAGAELVTIGHQPAGFCGDGAESASDSLVDSISLAPGATASYTITARVHPGARGDLVNTAEAMLPGDVVALTPDEHSATDEAPISVVTELGVVKAISGETTALVAGGPVGFLIELSNAGPSHGFGARVADFLPGVINDATWTCESIPADTLGSFCPAGGNGDIDESVDVLVGERLLIRVQGAIDPSFRGQLSNTALVEAPLDASDPDPDNNESSVSGTVNAVSDIRIAKSVAVEQSFPGELVIFDILVTNDGPSDAPLVSVEDTPPPGMSFESWQCVATNGACTSSGSGAIAETISLDAGGTAEFTVSARIDGGLAVPATLDNQASAVLGGEGSDPVPGNDTDSASVEIVAAEADLWLTKTVDAGAALPGDPLEYQITVTNAGPGLADAVRVVDTMPAGLVSVSWSCQGSAGASCAVASGSGDIDTTTSMPAGGQLLFVVTGQIDPGLPSGPDERVVNTATVSLTGDTSDPEPGNNEDTAATVLDLDVIFRDRFEAAETTQEFD